MTSPTEILSEDSLGQKRISFFSGNKLLECWIEKDNILKDRENSLRQSYPS